MADLLISEPPLQVLPSLAVKVGLNEAIILQQIHYWLQKSKHVHDGHTWIYNSYSGWQKQFPFWSRNTIIRAINRLEKDGYLITANYNKAKFDKTKWYRIDYQKLVGNSSTQNGQTNNPEQADLLTQNGQTNTSRLPETTSETNNNHKSPVKPDKNTKLRKEIIGYLNERTNSKYKVNAAKNKQVIKARLNEGYTIDDFKKVVDNKILDWGNDDKMSDYLRPETLFGPKMDGYLNEHHSNGPTGDKFEQEEFDDEALPF